MPMSDDLKLIGVEQRIRQLANAEETVLGYAPTSTTDQGVYFVVLRHYPHPDVDGASVLNVRYAYLTRGEGSDGWLDNGVNVRIEGDPAEFLAGLAQLFAAAQPRLDGEDDPATTDLTPSED